MKIFVYLLFCNYFVSCDNAPRVSYPRIVQVGQPINPYWLTEELNFETYIAELNEKHRLAEKSLVKREVTEEEMKWLAERLEDRKNGLKVRLPDDGLWKYDNREWTSFSGRAGIVLLRGGVVVWHEQGKHQ